MKKSILVIEPFYEKENHLSFNTKILSYLNKKNNIYFCGSSSYCLGLKNNGIEIEDSFCINYKHRNLPEFIRRYVYIFSIIISNSKKNDKIIFLSFDNTLFFLFLIFSKIFLLTYNKKIIAFSHYNTYTIYSNKIKKNLFKLTTRAYKKIQYIVLTEFAYQMLTNIVDAKNVLFIKHPINKIYSSTNNLKKNENIIRYTIVGRQAKNAIDTGFIYKLISVLDSLVKNSNLKIELVIGSNLFLNLDCKYTLQISQRNNLTRSEYELLFDSSDFIIFPYKKEDSFRASGILTDALSHNKPFIAPCHGHFKEFEGCGLFYNKEELEQQLYYSAHMTDTQYSGLVSNIKKTINKIEVKNNIIFSEI